MSLALIQSPEGGNAQCNLKLWRSDLTEITAIPSTLKFVTEVVLGIIL